ncbi:PRP5 [Acrasis kona]|uniref:PRP5 n=1 Tax=Acrasis kona TaxID=1008807 RepID=A0AAW2YIN3_9EUKA
MISSDKPKNTGVARRHFESIAKKNVGSDCTKFYDPSILIKQEEVPETDYDQECEREDYHSMIHVPHNEEHKIGMMSVSDVLRDMMMRSGREKEPNDKMFIVTIIEATQAVNMFRVDGSEIAKECVKLFANDSHEERIKGTKLIFELFSKSHGEAIIKAAKYYDDLREKMTEKETMT